MSHDRLNVTLTASENTYLTYPVEGEIEFFEIGLRGSLLKAIFRVVHPSGWTGPTVEVRNPEFTFSPEVANRLGRARATWNFATPEVKAELAKADPTSPSWLAETAAQVQNGVSA